MKYILAFFLLAATAGFVQAQSVSELEGRLRRATNKSDRLNLTYALAEKLLPSNPGKAADYAEQASQLATEMGDKNKQANADYYSAEGKFRIRSYKDASARFNTAWNSARNYGLRDLALQSTSRLQEIAVKQNDLREALKWSTETINYLKENSGASRGGGDAQRRLENRLGALEAENRSLRDQLAKATGQTSVLENTYRETEAQLKEVQEKSQQEISIREATTHRLDSIARNREGMVITLTKEQLADSIVQAQQERELQVQKRKLAEVELAREQSEYQRKQSEYLRNIVGVIGVFVLLLALLFYARYRSKRKTADELSTKNILIEEEQKRSNRLLLNILPPAIAEELKTRNKVKARQYDKATVMFIDFKGFTNVAERLSPEELVQELDYCFTNFDRIIGRYRIEKIKTIGDAYLCASGLSDMNASPSDIVKAALEIQDFMLHVKAERMGRGLPFFEARVGIHTGPVVAGVVGETKFAYDIWGDTVNIAARMEEACDPGRVNVSEDAHWLSKYEFEWQSRGKIAAKNKGLMDMYYVTALKSF